MTRQALVLAVAIAGLVACNNTSSPTGTKASSSPGAAAASATPSAGASTSTSASATDHFLVDGTPAPLSGKSTITSFASGAVSCNFGLAPLTIPEKYIFTVDVKLQNYPDVSKGAGMADVASASGGLAIDQTTPTFKATWTPTAANGITFSFSTADRKVTLSWKGDVKDASGATHNVDAVMTNVAVPFK